MPETVADVLVRLGVDTEGLRAGFRDARSQTANFATEFAQLLTFGGGSGSILQGLARAGGSLIPGPFGAIFRGLSGFFSSIGGLFTRAARRAAKEIRQNLQEILAAYRAGSTALGETIRKLEAERESAIRRLSGKKGGRKELDKLLPEFDRALAELRARQQAIFEQFDASLELLRTGEAFRDVAADVREVIRQYREYVDAGGDLTRANEFLSRSLEELRASSAVELGEGEQAAIEDALKLNDLLREREELLAESAEAERRIRTRGVLERQRTVAQDKAAELEALRRQRDERLAELDQQIQLLQLKVDIESRVFDLTRDRIALETRLLELKEQEFERETARLAALRDVVAGIVPGAAGALTLTPVLQQQLNLGGVQIFLGGSATPEQAQRAGEQVIEGMMRALVQERARFGRVA
jgi:hypothetical protein